ncbi:MAG: triose-phosphate isomerase [Nitratireductor sp.]
MTPNIKPLVAGNWKMNGDVQALGELDKMLTGFKAELRDKADLMICPPATLLGSCVGKTTNTPFLIGAQDCHANAKGAHTGDISAHMIKDIGASCVIVGHSERRTDHGEQNADVLAKAQAGIEADLMSIVCIGESEAERKSGETLNVLKTQMEGSLPETFSSLIVIAYEPVWAIGTGLTPNASDVEEAHVFMRQELVKRYGDAGNSIRLLYGGSVKPANAKELMSIENVDGALVGGASLKAEDFLGICKAYL